MKKIVLLAVLLLASCIDVGDFGDYWDKGLLDPALAGEWEGVSEAGQSGSNVHFYVEEDGGAYKVLENDNGREKTYEIKTLAAGPYRFLMVFDGDRRDFVRYEVDDDEFSLYILKDEPAWAFIKKRVPKPKIFSLEQGTWPVLKIKTLNEDVIKLLGAFPDNETYWEKGSVIRRKSAHHWGLF